MRFLLLTGTCAALLLAIATAPASAAEHIDRVRIANTSAESGTTGIGIRLVDVPTAAQDDPRARSYIVDNLAPGTTIERRIEVTNDTSAEQTIALYVGSAHITGGSFLGHDGAAANALTSWTSVNQPDMTLDAGASAQALVTVVVPLEAPEGEQYAAIWAEVSSPPDPSSNVVSTSRVGIRMYLSVSPGNGPPAAFTVTQLTASRDESGVPQVTATVTNTGGRALDISGTLELSEGPSGLSAGPFATTTATTLGLGATDEVVVALGPDLPNGPWQAKLTLASGLLTQDTDAEITFPESERRVDVVINAAGPNLALILGVAIVLLVGAAAVLWLRQRRRIAKRAADRVAMRGRRARQVSR